MITFLHCISFFESLDIVNVIFEIILTCNRNKIVIKICLIELTGLFAYLRCYPVLSLHSPDPFHPFGYHSMSYCITGIPYCADFIQG